VTTLQRTKRRPNGHSHEVGLTPAEAQCPFCGAPLRLSQLTEIRTRMAAEEAARLAKREQQIKHGFAREMAKAEAAKKAEVARAVKQATEVADKKLQLIRQNQDAVVAARVNAERATAARKLSEAVNAEKLAHAAEKLRLETTLAEVQRRLAAKTPFQIGEKPEVDLFESMKLICASDRVTRTPRGTRGGDVLIEVLLRDTGETAGKILLDSKSHSKWQSTFTRKLLADKSAIDADFALLVSAVLPANEQQICIRDSVICCVPERAPILVSLLRKVIVDNFVLKLSAERRDEKASRLLDFIVSAAGTDLFDRLLKVTRDLEALDVTEQKSHKITWAKRAELVQGVITVHEQFVRTVGEIISGTEPVLAAASA
jgi:hypothetical protein